MKNIIQNQNEFVIFNHIILDVSQQKGYKINNIKGSIILVCFGCIASLMGMIFQTQQIIQIKGNVFDFNNIIFILIVQEPYQLNAHLWCPHIVWNYHILMWKQSQATRLTLTHTCSTWLIMFCYKSIRTNTKLGTGSLTIYITVQQGVGTVGLDGVLLSALTIFCFYFIH